MFSQEFERKRNQEVREDTNPQSIAFACITSFPDYHLPYSEGNIRGHLALQTFQEAHRKGYPVFVVDKNSTPVFLAEARRYVTFVESKGETMSDDRRILLEEIRYRDAINYIILTEAEKLSLVDSIPHIIERFTPDIDIVIPRRMLDSFASLPTVQMEKELRANVVFHQLMDRIQCTPECVLDVWFGVRAMRNKPQVLDLFINSRYTSARSQHDAERWFNSLFLPVIRALQEEIPITSVDIPYLHSKRQTMYENNDPRYVQKRWLQYWGILTLTRHYIKQCSIKK